MPILRHDIPLKNGYYFSTSKYHVLPGYRRLSFDQRPIFHEEKTLTATFREMLEADTSNMFPIEEAATRIQSLARVWLARQECALLAREVYHQGWDPSYERVYYWNARTGFVSWSRPVLLREQNSLTTNTTLSGSDQLTTPQRLRISLPAPVAPNPVAPGDGARGVEFLELCTKEKQRLFDEHRRQVLRSMRHWEHHQLEEKARARANRLAKLQSENHDRLADLQQGARAYNLKSIRQAAVQGDVSRLTELLGLGFNADASSAMGLTPLLGACQSGCLEAVRVLLQHGADVNLQHVKSKRTPLMEASGRECPDIVRELLRYGARLGIQDVHGESASDCAKDPLIKQHLDLAASTWSSQNAELFPIPFRAAGRTLLLIQKRQQNMFSERRIAMKRELSILRPTLQRAAAEAKMRYDESIRQSHAQITLLKKVEVLNQADAQFDDDRAQLLKKFDVALLLQAEAETPRVLPSASITRILAFCGRHWFDQTDVMIHRQQRRRRPKRLEVVAVLPIAKRVGLHVLPHEVEADWNEFQRTLAEQCQQLRRVQTEELSDAENGVTRSRDGKSLAQLSVCVHEAQELPFREPRLNEPIDPQVRLMLRNQQLENAEVLSTDGCLGDRYPTWETSFTFTVESVKSDLVVQIVDSKRREVAGEVVVSLRTLLDQKEHGDWLVLPPTLRQQAMEKAPRQHAARVRLTLRLVHTQSILLTRQIQQSLTKRTQLLGRRRAFMQSVLDDCIKKLGGV